MIRCIYIGDQIVDGGTSFAFYDTVTDEFVDLGRGSVWDSFEDVDDLGGQADVWHQREITVLDQKFTEVLDYPTGLDQRYPDPSDTKSPGRIE